MSEVETEKSKLGGWGTAALLLGTAAAVIYGWPVIAALATHYLITGAVVAGAGAYVATDEGRREKAKSIFSKVGGWYKDAFSNLLGGWGKATKWAEAKEAAAKAAAEPESTSTLGSKEVAPGFKAAVDGAKVTVSAPKPAPKSTPAPGM